MKEKYLEVGRTMKDYEDRKYELWKENTELSLPNLMKKSLLTKVHPSTLCSQRCPAQQQLQGPFGGSVPSFITQVEGMERWLSWKCAHLGCSHPVRDPDSKEKMQLEK